MQFCKAPPIKVMAFKFLRFKVKLYQNQKEKQLTINLRTNLPSWERIFKPVSQYQQEY